MRDMRGRNFVGIRRCCLHHLPCGHFLCRGVGLMRGVRGGDLCGCVWGKSVFVMRRRVVLIGRRIRLRGLHDWFLLGRRIGLVRRVFRGPLFFGLGCLMF